MASASRRVGSGPAETRETNESGSRRPGRSAPKRRMRDVKAQKYGPYRIHEVASLLARPTRYVTSVRYSSESAELAHRVSSGGRPNRAKNSSTPSFSGMRLACHLIGRGASPTAGTARATFRGVLESERNLGHCR